MKAEISELFKNSLNPQAIPVHTPFQYSCFCFGNNRRLSNNCQFYFSSAQLHMPTEIQGYYFRSLVALVLHNYSNCFLLRPKNSRAFPALSLSCKNKTHTYVCAQLIFNSNAFYLCFKRNCCKETEGSFPAFAEISVLH